MLYTYCYFDWTLLNFRLLFKLGTLSTRLARAHSKLPPMLPSPCAWLGLQPYMEYTPHYSAVHSQKHPSCNKSVDILQQLVTTCPYQDAFAWLNCNSLLQQVCCKLSTDLFQVDYFNRLVVTIVSTSCNWNLLTSCNKPVKLTTCNKSGAFFAVYARHVQFTTNNNILLVLRAHIWHHWSTGLTAVQASCYIFLEFVAVLMMHLLAGYITCVTIAL